MPRHKNQKRRGNALVEFTLVGIPMIFLLISTFEIARGMWTYHTLAYAVKEGTRYASVHGKTCTVAPNSCAVTVAQIAQRVSDSAAGLVPDSLTLTFTSLAGSFSCTVTNCLANNATWPPDPANQQGSDIEIDGVYPFQSAISMFWPGAGPAVTVGAVNFPASSQETMQN
jgi:Flp pilus assembly protein TadG